MQEKFTIVTGVVKDPPGSGGDSERGIEEGYIIDIRADYTLASPIPESDLAFDWRLMNIDKTVAPYQSNGFHFVTSINPYISTSALDNANRKVSFTGYANNSDFEVYVQVRMKQISTNTYLTDWYTAPGAFYWWW